MITTETQKILKAVADLNDHGIYPSDAEVVRRAFGRLKFEDRFDAYLLITFMVGATGELVGRSEGYKITDKGKETLAAIHV